MLLRLYNLEVDRCAVQEKITYNPGEDPTEKIWTFRDLGLMLLGVLFVGFGIYLYYEFAELEKSGGSIRISWWVAILYKIFGKEITSFLFALPGAIVAGLKLKKLVESK